MEGGGGNSLILLDGVELGDSFPFPSLPFLSLGDRADRGEGGGRGVTGTRKYFIEVEHHPRTGTDPQLSRSTINHQYRPSPMQGPSTPEGWTRIEANPTRVEARTKMLQKKLIGSMRTCLVGGRRLREHAHDGRFHFFRYAVVFYAMTFHAMLIHAIPCYAHPLPPHNPSADAMPCYYKNNNRRSIYP